MDLNGKAAIVTGAGSGVGRATALGLADRGCRVVVNDLDEHAVLAVAKQIREHGVDAVAVQGDVSQDADCRALAAAASREFGRLDVLINNAGTTTLIPHAELDAVTDEDWERTQNVNLKGPFQCARAATDLL